MKSQMKEMVYLKDIKWLCFKIDTHCVHYDVGTDVAGIP